MSVDRYWVEQCFIPELGHLRRAAIERVIPTFDSISQEADDVADRTYSALSSSGGPERDLSVFADIAFSAGMDHYTMLSNTRQAIVNLFSVAIRHLVEQQMLVMLRRRLLPEASRNDASQITLERFVQALKERGIDVTKSTAWGDLEELRLVANTVKHAEGKSARELRSRRPEMFVHPENRHESDTTGKYSHQFVYQPLSGEDIYVTIEDLERYFRAATTFWKDLLRVAEQEP